jgi:hypothetical protein
MQVDPQFLEDLANVHWSDANDSKGVVPESQPTKPAAQSATTKSKAPPPQGTAPADPKHTSPSKTIKDQAPVAEKTRPSENKGQVADKLQRSPPVEPKSLAAQRPKARQAVEDVKSSPPKATDRSSKVKPLKAPILPSMFSYVIRVELSRVSISCLVIT